MVSAEPVIRGDFEKFGMFRLTLRKITNGMVSPGEVLFSLPTICDEIPGIAAVDSAVRLC